MIGGAALVVVTAGAATAGHLISSQGQAVAQAVDGTVTNGRASVDRGVTVDGNDLSGHSATPGAGRSTTDISRSGSRPAPPPATGSTGPSDRTDAARRQVAVRADTLRTATSQARGFAAALAREQAEAARAHEQAAAARAHERALAQRQAQASNAWVLPTSGFHISTWFGEPGPYWASGYHTGIDFATAYGTPVVAVADGTVAQTGYYGAYGNQIRLQFENGDQVWYNHLSTIEVSVGDTVLKGGELGRVGDTGNSYGAHLHFEYRLASDLSTAVDPAPFFEEHGIHLS